MEKVKGLSLFKVTYTLTIATAIIFVILLITTVKVNKKFNETKETMRVFVVYQDSSQNVKKAANQLTDLARLFIETENPDYAVEYIDTKFNKRLAERAFDRLKTVCSEDEMVYQRLETALDHSEALANLELYSMKLVFYSNPAIQNKMPVQIKNTKLNKEDARKSPQELKALAKEALFGESYLVYKKAVDDNCDETVQIIEDSLNADLNSSSHELGTALFRLNILLGSLVAFLIAFFIFQVKSVFKPLRHFINAIKFDLPLEEVGSVEFKALAVFYNDSYNLKQNNEKQLLNTAEHDALTGILNRRAFEQICQKSSEAKDSIAILLIDLDNFKHVNDTYGHKMGDAALKTLARALTSVFRKDDYVCRIGGDEFSVILKDFNPAAESVIYTKISQVSEIIKNVDDQFGITISVGAAISSEGYTTELFQNADKALYVVKQNGKNGCEIYQESMAATAPSQPEDAAEVEELEEI